MTDTFRPDPKNKPIRLKGKAYTKFRLEVCEAHHWRCDKCHLFTPPVDRDGVFDVFTCGHVSHIKSRGAGGGDTLDNVGWECYDCHIVKKHGTRFGEGRPG